MCLLINKNQKPKIAKEPIVCYKCLTRDMLSPCYRQKYELDKLLTSEFSIEIGNNCDKVEKGLHTFANELEAKYVAREFSWWNQITGDYYPEHASIIVKCIIPKGSQYFVGNSTDWRPGYASDKIIFTSIIKEYRRKVEIASVDDYDCFNLESEVFNTLTKEVLPKPVCLNVDVIPDVKPNEVRNLGTKYITSILLFLTALIGFSACTIKQSPDEIEKFRLENRQIQQSEFTSDGHKYKVFMIWNTKYLSVVHDPDCDCHSR